MASTSTTTSTPTPDQAGRSVTARHSQRTAARTHRRPTGGGRTSTRSSRACTTASTRSSPGCTSGCRRSRSGATPAPMPRGPRLAPESRRMTTSTQIRDCGSARAGSTMSLRRSIGRGASRSPAMGRSHVGGPARLTLPRQPATVSASSSGRPLIEPAPGGTLHGASGRSSAGISSRPRRSPRCSGTSTSPRRTSGPTVGARPRPSSTAGTPGPRSCPRSVTIQGPSRRRFAT